MYICTTTSFQFSYIRLFETPWTVARQSSLSITNSQRLLKLMSIESVMSSNHLILCCPLLLLPSIFPSIRVFSNESVLHIRWPKYWSFSFNISLSSEYSELISFIISFTTSLSSSFLRPSLVKPSQVSRRNNIVNTINEIMPRIKMKVVLDRPDFHLLMEVMGMRIAFC